MKKVGIMTIYDENNYGNRLQNYAVQTILRKMGFDVETIKYNIDYTLSIVKPGKRLDCFREFNKKINFAPDELIMSQNSKIEKNLDERYDYVIIGSDQIWNYNFKLLFSDKIFGSFVSKEKRIALSASIGVDELPELSERFEISKRYMNEMKGISVREFSGKKLVKEISGREDVEVLVDPTMLLKEEEWEKISKKPDWFNNQRKYILKYFLGESEQDKNVLKEFADKHDFDIIDIGDEKSKYYDIGPAEFLYLEKNAQIVVTDSFHACVFAILFNTPLAIHKRIDKNERNMYSRMETLMEKFNLKHTECTGVLNEEFFRVNKELLAEKLKYERTLAKNYLERFLIND